MRSFYPSAVIGLLVFVGLGASSPATEAGDSASQPAAELGGKNECSVVDSQSTLSSLGIDFGAAELLRYTKLGLSGAQKQRALGVVREVKPTIDRLCERMTRALEMDESSPVAKQAKQEELEAVVDRFKRVQDEIMSGLQAIITPEQGAKLHEIKRHEQDLQARAKPAPER